MEGRKNLLIGAILVVLLSNLTPRTTFAAGSDKPSGKIVKEIRISKLRFTKPEIIRRELVSQVGRPYLEENARKDVEKLDRLRIFSSINIEPIEENGEIILQVEVKETFPHLPIISLDVSDENGTTVGPGFKSLNLFGRAISFSGAARFGGANTVKMTVEDPWFAGKNHLSYRLEFDRRDRVNKLDDFNEKSDEFETRIGSYLGENGRIGGRVNFVSVQSDSPGITLSGNNRDNIPTLGFFVGYDSRDLWTDPRRGWWNEFEISRSLGDGDFWTFHFDIRRFQSLADRHLLAFFSLTTLRTGTVGEQIPVHQDFHLGGNNTIRGWSLDSGRGKNQFINTVEYRYTLMSPKQGTFWGFTAYLGVQLAAFGDFGIAWNDGDQFRAGNFLNGYGLGLRLIVPFVDLIRIDFAFGEPGGGMRSHFGMREKAIRQRERVR